MLKLFLDSLTLEKAISGKCAVSELLAIPKSELGIYADKEDIEKLKESGKDNGIKRITAVNRPKKKDIERFKEFIKNEDMQTTLASYMRTDCSYLVTSNREFLRKVGNAVTPREVVEIVKKKGIFKERKEKERKEKKCGKR